MILELLIMRVTCLFVCNDLMHCLTTFTHVRLDWMHVKKNTRVWKLKWDTLRALGLLLHG